MKIRNLLYLGSALIVSLSSLFLINFGTALAAANNCTWTGGGDGVHFNDASNWTSCNGTVPQNGDDLFFSNSSLGSEPTITNDLTNLSVNTVVFQGTGSTYSFQIGGNGLTVTGGLTDTTTSSFPSGFDTTLTLSGNQTLATTNTNGTYFQALDGSGNLAVTGGGWALIRDMSTYTGTVSSTDSVIELEGGLSDTFTSTGLVSVSGNATLDLFDNGGGKSASTLTYSLPISLGGVGVANKGEALYLDGGQTGAVQNVLAGSVTLTSDVGVLATGSNTLNITGPINYNGFTMSSVGSNVTTITVASGTDHSSENPMIGKNVTFVDDGKIGTATVASGGLLEGSGSTSGLSVQSSGIVAPGHSPGCLSTGNLTLNGTYQVQLGGTTACSGYDQLNVTGTVDVTNATLDTSLYGTFKPKAGNSFTIINNDGTDKVTGTFKNLAEGATFKVSGYVFKITYKGGTGNDVVLSVVSVPSTPDTGFAFSGANPTTTLIGTLAATAALLLIGRKTKLAYKRR